MTSCPALVSTLPAALQDLANYPNVSSLRTWNVTSAGLLVSSCARRVVPTQMRPSTQLNRASVALMVVSFCHRWRAAATACAHHKQCR